MRFKTESRKAKHARLTEWHTIFALLPHVIATNGVDHWAWLEKIERKGRWDSWRFDSLWTWEYREIDQPK